jgi:hypothetical protein
MTGDPVPARVRDPRKLRPQLENIRVELGPAVTLADVIRKFLREGIERHNRQKKGTS